MSPPGEKAGPLDKGRPSAKYIDRDADTASVCLADDVPVPLEHPWHGRPDAHILEERFRRDRAGWRRRIDCARRLTYDARDEAVAPDGRWTT
jgi:hypothetical protein